MKRYLLFAGDSYYPVGGLNDFVDAFDSVEDAVQRGNNKYASKYRAGEACDEFDWWHVYDGAEGKIAAKSEYQAYGPADDGPTLRQVTLPANSVEVYGEKD